MRRAGHTVPSHFPAEIAAEIARRAQSLDAFHIKEGGGYQLEACVILYARCKSVFPRLKNITNVVILS